MTTTIAQSLDHPTQSRHVHAPKLKSSKQWNASGSQEEGCSCSTEGSSGVQEGLEATERVYKSISLYVKVLARAMGGPSCAVGAGKVSKLSEFLLKSVSTCLSCGENGDVEAIIRKIEELSAARQDYLIPTLLRGLLLQASFLATAGSAENDSAEPLQSLPNPSATPVAATLNAEASRDRTLSDIPSLKEDGVGVPQVDLDELLWPSGGPEQCLLRRQGLKDTLLKKSRARSNSDFLSYQQVDLRPTWMRSPRLYKAVIQKMRNNPSPPLFYVEWNILGLRKAVDRKESVRIVSPKFTPISANPALKKMGLGPLRIMIALERIPNTDTCEDNDKGQKVQMGIFFTLADDVEVRYRLFHPSFLSESRWHSFQKTPWAGLPGNETGCLKVSMSEVVTVGVAIETFSIGGKESATWWDTGTLPSMSSLIGVKKKFAGDLSPPQLAFSSETASTSGATGRNFGEAKLPLQQSLSRMSLSSAAATSSAAADRRLFAHIWSDRNYQ